jgi:hypothetical protein
MKTSLGSRPKHTGAQRFCVLDLDGIHERMSTVEIRTLLVLEVRTNGRGR